VGKDGKYFNITVWKDRQGCLMRIAFILTQDLESPSGLGRYFPIARQLSARGHTVHISALHPDYQALTERQFVRDGVQVNYVAPMHVRKQGNLKHYYRPVELMAVSTRAVFRLSQDVLRQRVDIIHVGKPHPMNSIAGLLGSLHKGQSLCVDCDDYEAGSMQFSAAWQKWLVATFERCVPRLSRLVSVNTHYVYQKLLDWGVPEDRIVYLPNGVAREHISWGDEGKVEDLRTKFGLTGNPVVAYLGSLSLSSHPVDLLLKAFMQIKNELPDAKLLIVGGGEDFPILVKMAAQMGLGDSVIFTGRVAPQEVPAYYRLAHVSVDPVHDNEAARGRSPLKMFESWAAGVPFVTSRVGDRTYFLEASGAGKLAADSTPEAYARAIAEVLANPHLAEKLRENGLNEVQHFTWDHLTDRLEQAYIELLGRTTRH
jgi:glycosyltransferase involved in cell wall biosynthesis